MSLVDYQPAPETSPKPAMTRREANWHAHVAGMRASEAAVASGADPAAVDALASGAAGARRIGGLLIPPLTIATFWALRDLSKSMDLSGIESQMVTLLAFLDPEAARQAAKDKDTAWLEDEAFNIATTMSPAAYHEIGQYIRGQMNALEALGGTSDDSPDAPAGKPPAANSAAS